MSMLYLQMTFTAPVIVASSVENLWLYGRKSHAKPHLTEALWLGCGAAGMKVCTHIGFSSPCVVWSPQTQLLFLQVVTLFQHLCQIVLTCVNVPVAWY